jgi:hypothetical protein
MKTDQKPPGGSISSGNADRAGRPNAICNPRPAGEASVKNEDPAGGGTFRFALPKHGTALRVRGAPLGLYPATFAPPRRKKIVKIGALADLLPIRPRRTSHLRQIKIGVRRFSVAWDLVLQWCLGFGIWGFPLCYCTMINPLLPSNHL